METPALTLRRAAPRDLARVDALFAASYPRLLKADYPPSVMVLAVPRLARANPRLLASGHYFVVESPDGRIVGAGGWSPGPAVSRMGEVRHLAVDPAFTRRGIARRILEAALAEARAAGVLRMLCLATRTGTPFYAAMGFTRLGPLTIGLAPGIEIEVERMLRAVD